MAVFDTPLFTSDQSIDRVLSAGLPVLLVFLNGPAAPALDQALKDVAKKDAGKLLVVQLNMMDSPESSRRFGISSAPAIVAYKGGKSEAQTESADAVDVGRYANFLLGNGPKPEPKVQQRSTAYAGVGQASAGAPAQSGPGVYGTPSTAYSPAGNGHNGQPVTVTDATFDQEVMRSSVPVVVDFWAPWCGPCRMVAPTLDKLAREWSGKVKIAKVNVDENPAIAGRYGITGIPTMMVVKGGRIVDQWAGALPEGPLRQRLSSMIG